VGPPWPIFSNRPSRPARGPSPVSLRPGRLAVLIPHTMAPSPASSQSPVFCKGWPHDSSYLVSVRAAGGAPPREPRRHLRAAVQPHSPQTPECDVRVTPCLPHCPTMPCASQGQHTWPPRREGHPPDLILHSDCGSAALRARHTSKRQKASAHGVWSLVSALKWRSLFCRAPPTEPRRHLLH